VCLWYLYVYAPKSRIQDQTRYSLRSGMLRSSERVGVRIIRTRTLGVEGASARVCANERATGWLDVHACNVEKEEGERVGDDAIKLR